MFGEAAAKAAGMLVTGVMGAAAYDAARRLVRGRTARAVAVGATAAGLRGVRAVELGAERVRLLAGDIGGEARVRIGEQNAPPAVGEHVH